MNKDITTEQYYKIIFRDGYTYYGRTKYHIYERWGNHLQTARLGIHSNKQLQEVYNKYGCDDWVFEILFVKVCSKEQHSICENTLIHNDSKALNIRKKLTPKQRKRRDEEIKAYSRAYMKRLYENETPEQNKIRLVNANKLSKAHYQRKKDKREEIKRSGDNKVV
tara:strand:- start:8 stop:502 length:495 start_codon:yes stop_codon:yes gene_type:complete